jgi:uncharacterized delta-60 repeat protein
MRGRTLGLALLMALAVPASAAARPGERDVTFPIARGFPGIPDSSEPEALGVLPGRRIAVAGSPASDSTVRVAVVAPDGRLDRRFGNRTLPRARIAGFPIDVAAAPGGKVLLAVFGNGDSFVARLTRAGRLDPTFGDGGVVRFPGEAIESVTGGPGGSVIAGGIGRRLDGTPGVLLALRLTSAGVPDPGFGTNGRVAIATAAPTEAVEALRDGAGVALAGSTLGPGMTRTLLWGRLTATGAAAPGFGPPGVVDGPQGTFRDAVRRPNGRLAILSARAFRRSIGTAVLQIGAGSALDPAFGTAGTAALPTRSPGGSLALMPDGKLVLAGDADVLRLTARGRRDPAFRSADFDDFLPATDDTSIDDLAATGDGRILVAGYGEVTVEDRFDFSTDYIPFTVRLSSGTDAITVGAGRAAAGGGRVTVRVGCAAPRGRRCRGTVALTRADRRGNRVVLARRFLSLSRGGLRARSLALTAAGRSAAARHGGTAARLDSVARDRQGYVATRRAAVRLTTQ